jgi:hypothetical protein
MSYSYDKHPRSVNAVGAASMARRTLPTWTSSTAFGWMFRSPKPAWAAASRAPTWRSPSRKPVAWGRLAGSPPTGYVSRFAGCDRCLIEGGERGDADQCALERDEAGDRAVAVNLLMPFVGRRDVEVCVDSRIDAAVIAFGRCPPRWWTERPSTPASRCCEWTWSSRRGKRWPISLEARSPRPDSGFRPGPARP